MAGKSTHYKLPVSIALLLHGLLLFFLLAKLDSPTPVSSPNHMEIINAVMVNQGALAQQKLEQQKATEQKQAMIRQQQAEIAKQQQLQQQMQQQEQQAKIKAEQLALKQQEEQQAKLAEQQKAAEVAKQQALLQQQKAAAEQEQEQEQKQLQTQKAAAAKQQAIQAIKQKAIAQAKQQLSDEQQKLQQQKTQQNDLSQELNSEQQQLSSARSQYTNSVVDKYKALIISAIAQRWLIPDNTDPNLSATLLIHLAPGGVVLNVQLITSSGNSALDSSAISAVYKASPLPVPTDPGLFDNFRDLNLTVRPQGIINTG